jgi:hypothetical protein
VKEKSELLEQIDELNNLKTELTNQVKKFKCYIYLIFHAYMFITLFKLSEMHTRYEQEKSKVHQLENELKKTKQVL